MTAELLVAAHRRPQEAVRRVGREGEVVRFVRCAFLPEEQHCLDLFEAGDATLVRRVNDIARVPFRWIGQASEYPSPDVAT